MQSLQVGRKKEVDVELKIYSFYLCLWLSIIVKGKQIDPKQRKA